MEERREPRSVALRGFSFLRGVLERHSPRYDRRSSLPQSRKGRTMADGCLINFAHSHHFPPSVLSNQSAHPTASELCPAHFVIDYRASDGLKSARTSDRLGTGGDYLRTRVLDQYKVNTAFWLFCNRSATSLVSKGRSSESSSRLSNSVISSAVLGLLIVFSAREMCTSRRRLELGICLIPATLSLRPS